MGKSGRPSKSGERYPSGQLKPQPKPQGDALSPVVIQRMFRDGAKLGIDPRLASEVGRLWCLRELTAQHAAVAFRIAGIYARFERAHGKRRSTKSPSYEMGHGGGEDFLDDAAAEEDAFKDLQGWMDTLLDWRLRGAIEQLCVEDSAISSLALPKVRAFFDRMAPILGLTGKAARAAKAATHKRRDGTPPLHFNAHEASSRDQGEAGAPPQRRPRSIEDIFWHETIQRLRPDLDENGVHLAVTITKAREARATERRRAEQHRKPDPVPLSQQYPMKLGRPTLRLTRKSDDAA